MVADAPPNVSINRLHIKPPIILKQMVTENEKCDINANMIQSYIRPSFNLAQLGTKIFSYIRFSTSSTFFFIYQVHCKFLYIVRIEERHARSIPEIHKPSVCAFCSIKHKITSKPFRFSGIVATIIRPYVLVELHRLHVMAGSYPLNNGHSFPQKLDHKNQVNKTRDH